MQSFRSEATENKYREFLKHNSDYCPYCHKDLLVQEAFYLNGEFIDGWMILENRFPYDDPVRGFKVSYMLALTEHTSELSPKQMREYFLFRNYLKGYDWMVLNMPNEQTIPGHFHVHLLCWK